MTDTSLSFSFFSILQPLCLQSGYGTFYNPPNFKIYNMLGSHQHPLHVHCVKLKHMDKFKYLEPIPQMLPPEYKNSDSHWRSGSRSPRCQPVWWSQLYSHWTAASVEFQDWTILLFLIKQTFHVLMNQEFFHTNLSIHNINIRNKHHLDIISYIISYIILHHIIYHIIYIVSYHTISYNIISYHIIQRLNARISYVQESTF